MTTKGEYRVGIDFNPSSNDLVARLKRHAADLIDLIEEVDPAIAGTECLRLKALAQSAIEDGAMWAVKAATKHAMPGGVEPMAPGKISEDPFILAIKAALEEFGFDPRSTHTNPNDLHMIAHGVTKRGFGNFGTPDLMDALAAIAKGA